MRSIGRDQLTLCVTGSTSLRRSVQLSLCAGNERWTARARPVFDDRFCTRCAPLTVALILGHGDDAENCTPWTELTDRTVGQHCRTHARLCCAVVLACISYTLCADRSQRDCATTTSFWNRSEILDLPVQSESPCTDSNRARAVAQRLVYQEKLPCTLL